MPSPRSTKVNSLWPFKDGNPHLLPSFATTFFQMPKTWALMGADILNFGLWKLFKEGNQQGILADFFQTFITWAWSGLFGHFLCSK